MHHSCPDCTRCTCANCDLCRCPRCQFCGELSPEELTAQLLGSEVKITACSNCQERVRCLELCPECGHDIESLANDEGTKATCPECDHVANFDEELHAQLELEELRAELATGRARCRGCNQNATPSTPVELHNPSPFSVAVAPYHPGCAAEAAAGMVE